MTSRFVVSILTYCDTLLSDNFEKENVYKITLNFIVHFDKQYGGVPYHLKA